MAEAYVQFVKWSTIFAGVWFVSAILSVMSADSFGDMIFSAIILLVLYAPYYAVGLFAALLLCIKMEYKKLFIYFPVIIISLIGVIVSYRNSDVDWDSLGLSYFLSTSLPFLITGFKAYYSWNLES